MAGKIEFSREIIENYGSQESCRIGVVGWLVCPIVNILDCLLGRKKFADPRLTEGNLGGTKSHTPHYTTILSDTIYLQ